MKEKFKFPPRTFFDNKKLRLLRLDRGMSVPKVSEVTGVHTNTLYNIENGKIYPRWDQLRSLLIAYNANLFEWCEILRIPCIEPQDIISFKARCKEQGVQAGKAMDDMIKVFCYEGV